MPLLEFFCPAIDLSLSKYKCVLVEVRLVLQGRAEVAHGHGTDESRRMGATTLARPLGRSQALDADLAA